MLKVVDYSNGGAIALVATAGLFLLRDNRGRIVGELLEEQEAKSIRQTIQNCSPDGELVEMVAYADAFKVRSS